MVRIILTITFMKIKENHPVSEKMFTKRNQWKTKHKQETNKSPTTYKWANAKKQEILCFHKSNLDTWHGNKKVRLIDIKETTMTAENP